MKHIWLYWLPLLYLPDLGYATATQFGTFTVSDYLIGPYLILLFLSLYRIGLDKFQPRSKLYVSYLIPTMLMFLWWCILSTITITFRYDYSDLYQLYFSILKLAKFSLYSLAGVLTSYALSQEKKYINERFNWALLIAGFMVGLTLLVSRSSLADGLTSTIAQQAFLDNPVSAMMAILIVYFVGLLISGNSTTRWRYTAVASMIVMVLGFVLAEGRGGWLAAIAGLLYIGFRLNLKQATRLAIAGIILFAVAYIHYPSFKKQVDRTFQPPPEYLELYNAGILGVDDGARLLTLQNEIPKLINDPLLGRGFYHRGGHSGIYLTGSHNFFVQMFLEVGIPGGILVLIIIRQMWRHASSPRATNSRLDLPIKAALVAAVVSGLSGEYFYGGMVLFTLLMAYAPIGSSVVQQSATRRFIVQQTSPTAPRN